MGFPLNGFTRFFFEEVSGRGEQSAFFHYSVRPAAVKKKMRRLWRQHYGASVFALLQASLHVRLQKKSLKSFLQLFGHEKSLPRHWRSWSKYQGHPANIYFPATVRCSAVRRSAALPKAGDLDWTFLGWVKLFPSWPELLSPLDASFATPLRPKTHFSPLRNSPRGFIRGCAVERV